MGIRRAKISDLEDIKKLLVQLEYDGEYCSASKLNMLLGCSDAELLVFEVNQRVAAVISTHYIPQLAIKGDFARISYFSVEQEYRSRGIGHELIQYCISLAQQRGCDRIEVHCHSRRELAHKFYYREGFSESPKYFIKKL